MHFRYSRSEELSVNSFFPVGCLFILLTYCTEAFEFDPFQFVFLDLIPRAVGALFGRVLPVFMDSSVSSVLSSSSVKVHVYIWAFDPF